MASNLNITFEYHLEYTVSNLGMCVCTYLLSCVWLFATLWTVACRQAPLSLGILQARILERGCHVLPKGIFQTQRSNPGLLHHKLISLLFESLGKPKNTAVGSLSLLQGIFPTQESNWGLLHCRQILYWLSYQGI